jgi:LacI family transcriptional regulator
MPRLTLEKIGELAGVSRSTVSRVINNQESVRPEVRQRVLRVIQETRFQPHAGARALAAQRTQVIGLVIPRSVQSFFADPYYPLLIQGIAQACNERRYTLSLFMFHNEVEEQDLYPRVLSRGLLDGVIITSFVEGDPLLPLLLESNMPFVLDGRPLFEGPINFVDVDNVAGSRNAVAHLVRLGRQRIGHIAGPLNTAVGKDRYQGYAEALARRGRSTEPALLAEGDFTEMSGYQACQSLIAAGVDAIFAASDKMALGALRALRDAGRSVPDDVAVVGFDDLEAAAISDPPLTTVRQPTREAGVIAVEMLLDIIEDEQEEVRQLFLPTQLVIRESCGAMQRDGRMGARR